MSEDQKRDPEGARLPPEHDEDARTDSGAADEPNGDADETERRRKADYVKMPPPVDEEAIAKHRAAKEARIRKRMEEKRQASGEEAKADPRDAGPKGPRVGKFSALPALRPDLKADTPALRAERVEAIRRDLVRRRRRKGSGILFKLWLFVLLPTSVVAWFLWFQASDLYLSESKFKVESADSGGSAGGGGLLGAFLGGGSAIFDPNAVHAFILSRDVLRKLDKDHAWIAHFQSPELDLLHQLPEDAGFEDAFSHYTEMVEVSFDPTEGIIEMSMVAADPDTARRFSSAVIGYSETMINDLSERIRADSESDAARNLVEAENRLRQAQEALAQLQKAEKTFSVEGEVAAEMAIIAGMEVELEALRGRRTNLLRVTGNSDPRVQRISNQIDTLTAQIDARRENITGERGAGDDASLADINLALTKARFEVEAATAIFAAAVQRNEVAIANSRRQHRYLAVISNPSVPDEANYPKKWQMTALAFLGFLGFYIVGSLTVSLIREQASI